MGEFTEAAGQQSLLDGAGDFNSCSMRCRSRSRSTRRALSRMLAAWAESVEIWGRGWSRRGAAGVKVERSEKLRLWSRFHLLVAGSGVGVDEERNGDDGAEALDDDAFGAFEVEAGEREIVSDDRGALLDGLAERGLAGVMP